MVKAIETARKAARKALESTYEGVATVVEYKKVMNEETKLIELGEVVVLEEQPCKLSFSKLEATKQNNSSASVTQVTKLFISPNITINPGSKITVTQTGITTDYTCSGVPAVYPTHQEIVLELFERWS